MTDSIQRHPPAPTRSMRLADFAQGRDNNFNLIRIVAALAVLVSHSFPIALGKGAHEPSLGAIGLSMVAVDVFFVTSGFLVTASLFNRQSTIDFVLARFLRIFPALWVMLLLTVFALGLSFTTAPAREYLASMGVYKYLAKCATLLAGVSFNLPGVFHANPYPDAVNGSLWTLPYEVRMYAILVLGWAILAVMKAERSQWMQRAIVAAAVVACVMLIGTHALRPSAGSPFVRLFYMFFAGSAFHVLRSRIMLRHTVFWALAAVVVFTALFAHGAFYFVYALALPYLLFWLAYVPGGPVRHYNRLGDYSYGTYIYAFPVQQAVSALAPGITVLGLGLSAAGLTLLLAALSWHLLEQPALALKGRAVGHAKGLVSGAFGSA